MQGMGWGVGVGVVAIAMDWFPNNIHLCIGRVAVRYFNCPYLSGGQFPSDIQYKDTSGTEKQNL